MELTGKAFVLNTMLQSVDCDLNQAMSLLTILRQALTEAREKFSDIYEDSRKIYLESNLYLTRRRNLHSTADNVGEIGMDVASNMYNEMINDMLHCLDVRFSEHSRPLYLALGALQPKTPIGNKNSRFLNWTIVKPLYEKYKHLIPDGALKVEMELNFLKTTLETLPEAEGGQPSHTRDVWKYLEHQGRHIFRSVLILYQIAHSLPVVTASAERTFSRLNLVKTILRSIYYIAHTYFSN